MPSSNPVVQKALKAQADVLKVAFVVGNGFDIGLGLKTKYTDFINKYLSKEVSVGSTIEKLKAKIAQGDLDWGDAEYAFGQLDFSKLGNDVESAYRESLHDFQMSLEEYLAEESSRFILPVTSSDVLRAALLKSIVDIVAMPNRGMIIGDKKIVQLNIVNFNYTDTVDQIFGSNTTPISYNIGDTKLVINSGRIVHSHGRIGQDILFGVDNPDQIGNGDLRYLSKTEGYLVKSTRAELGNCGFYGEAQEMLDSSDVLVLFGLSYGKTDRIWWNRIFLNLRRAYSADKRFDVILCPYTENPIDVYTIDDRQYIERREKERFFANLPISNVEYMRTYPRLVNRIHVIGYGPYKDLASGQSYYCDPLHLHSMGLRYVNGYDGKPIVKAKYP